MEETKYLSDGEAYAVVVCFFVVLCCIWVSFLRKISALKRAQLHLKNLSEVMPLLREALGQKSPARASYAISLLHQYKMDLEKDIRGGKLGKKQGAELLREHEVTTELAHNIREHANTYCTNAASSFI